MIEFKRNKKTGNVEVWKNGKKTGIVRGMGDDVKKGGKDGKVQIRNKSRQQG